MLVNWQDAIDEEIVNATLSVASISAKPRTSRTPRQRGGANQAARETERLMRAALAQIGAIPELSDPPEDEVAEVAALLKRYEVRGALQALLTARLTRASEVNAARAREAVLLALAGASTPGNRQGTVINVQFAQRWSKYFDDRISAVATLVDAELDGQRGHSTEIPGGQGVYVGSGGVQINFFPEASSSRLEALLEAIERQVTALADPANGSRAEEEFSVLYRRQVHRRHGFLIPPDFDRRLRVPVEDIYVPTAIEEADSLDKVQAPPTTKRGSLNVWDLTRRINRTVLLGDPGGGKTTAANVLADRFARDPVDRIPFVVTLREYAERTPIEWSVAEHIEDNLRTLYQSPASVGLVERLLLTGRAVVIFDGLDELLDTSRRRAVSDRVEQFCSAYPLTPVLVTSRVVGYDQARLDHTQFTCYRLGGFGDDEMAQYARKWFRTQDGVAAAEAEAKAEAFLTESANAKDLRANPLLLSLMCILYRGAGSLPGDRVGIYAQCAELLFRQWDKKRELYQRVKADHLVEPTIRYLAWWLFTREDSRTTATEQELVDKAAEFLHTRSYETEDEARDAAREFIEFCRGRMWVFSDIGTTPTGQKLYGFTHRTFLEYFAAWHLAFSSNTPEDLAREIISNRKLIPDGSSIISELAIKIMADRTNYGADRVYEFLLSPPSANKSENPRWRFHGNPVTWLSFVLGCLNSTRPSPRVARIAARSMMNETFGNTTDATQDLQVLVDLIDYGADYKEAIIDEIWAHVSDLLAADDWPRCNNAIRIILALDDDRFAVKGSEQTRSKAHAGFTAIGRYILAHRARPWLVASHDDVSHGRFKHDETRPITERTSFPSTDMHSLVDEITALGFSATLCMAEELKRTPHWTDWIVGLLPEFRTLADMVAEYSAGRISRTPLSLAQLPLQEPFQYQFQEWAEGSAAFVKHLPNRLQYMYGGVYFPPVDI